MTARRHTVRIFHALCVFIIAGSFRTVFSETSTPPSTYPGLSRLSASDSGQLAQGEIIIRSVKNPASLALVKRDAATQSVLARISAVSPNYLEEMIAVHAISSDREGTQLLEALKTNLVDVKSYVGIPYFSRQQKKTYPLFDRMDILGTQEKNNALEISVMQHMEPFDQFKALYSIKASSLDSADSTPELSALEYQATNLEGIIYTYQKFKAVEPRNMVWILYAYIEDGYMVFYGVGAVKAFDLFGIFRSRLEASFIGRIDAFFSEMHSRMMSGYARQ